MYNQIYTYISATTQAKDTHVTDIYIYIHTCTAQVHVRQACHHAGGRLLRSHCANDSQYETCHRAGDMFRQAIAQMTCPPSTRAPQRCAREQNLPPRRGQVQASHHSDGLPDQTSAHHAGAHMFGMPTTTQVADMYNGIIGSPSLRWQEAALIHKYKQTHACICIYIYIYPYL